MLDNTQQEQQIQRFLDALAQAQPMLADCAPEKDLAEFSAYQETFRRKVADFYRENRKLNIGVVGQVKAGKSSFLNTLLFEGREVLPKAATPKTAALTRMEYAEENAIEVEYYTPDEWEIQRENAALDLDGDVYASARELVEMVCERVRAGKLDPGKCLEKGKERLDFDTYEHLIDRLNDYVGVDGTYTPLVKSVSLYLHNEQFQGLSIVDTPGLNDPIVSRTIRTKEFIEVCDVVFFLSQSGSFLDSTDWGLLSAQLPQGGVKRLVLIGSKYDSALRDVLQKRPPSASPFGSSPFARMDPTHADNVPDACRIAAGTLSRRAVQQVEQEQKRLRQMDCGGALLSVIEQCKKPILFSSMACNMGRKPREEYTSEEEKLYQRLSQFSGDMDADLKRIGDIAPIQALFDGVKREKERILREKSGSLTSDAVAGLSVRLSSWAEQAQSRSAILAQNDRTQLEARKLEVERQQNKIREAISDVFGKRIDALKKEKSEGIAVLRTSSGRLGKLDAKTGTREEEHSYTVSTSKWYKPWTWGRTETRYYTTTVNYTYMVSSEAAENLYQYAKESANQIEKVFTAAVNLRELRQQLCAVVVNHMDMGDERFDSAYFRKRVNDLVDQVSFPTIHIDATGVVEQHMAKFKGNITDEEGMTELQNALRAGLEALTRELVAQFDREAEAFLRQLRAIDTEFQDTLLQNIREDLDQLMGQLAKKEEEIARLNAYQEKLGEVRRMLEVAG